MQLNRLKLRRNWQKNAERLVIMCFANFAGELGVGKQTKARERGRERDEAIKNKRKWSKS